jgi:LysM repeat protein
MTVITDLAAADSPSCSAGWRRRAGVGIATSLVVLAVPHASSGLDHTVAPGETLGLIAPTYGTSIEAIVDANGLADPNRIISGQVLTIPESASPTTTHIVVLGETLGVIAEQYGLTAADLAAANGIADVNLVREGTVLTIGGATPSPAAGSAPESHTVATGETLAEIAARYDTTVAMIVEANGLGDPNLIVEGATLSIGAEASQAAPVAATPAIQHVVAPGETLGVIAANYATTAMALAALNGIDDVNTVVIGQQLSIPSTPTTPSATAVVGTDTAPLLEQWARVYGVPVDLFKALTWFESGWNNAMVSSVGALGVGQLMPATVEFVSTELLNEPIDPNDLSDNIRASARFLRYLLDETGWDATSAIGSYYQGLAATREHGIYPSSWFYIEGILALRSRF